MIYRDLLIALAAKPFVILTGNSGTGKTKVAELLAQWLRGKDSGGYTLVAVGADWTDNRNVLGFVNYLRSGGPDATSPPVYQSTAILNLLLKAHSDRDMPYFLILDEMNLSHVERYFADFLSAMESKSGKLLLHSEPGPLPLQAGAEPTVLQTLKIPDNLFVVGTVNVDETTYMFSPKVLDRANVIEFRMDQGVVKNFLKSGGEIKDMEQADPSYTQTFLELSRKARSRELVSFGKEADRTAVNEAIETLFGIMASEKLEFGYRTMNEILRYFAVDFSLTEDKGNWKWQPVFDIQMLQKVLPKLHGSKRKIEGLLLKLAVYCETGKPLEKESEMPANLLANPVTGVDSPAFEKSCQKLCEMIDTVRRDQFVSFIQ